MSRDFFFCTNLHFMHLMLGLISPTVLVNMSVSFRLDFYKGRKGCKRYFSFLPCKNQTGCFCFKMAIVRHCSPLRGEIRSLPRHCQVRVIKKIIFFRSSEICRARSDLSCFRQAQARAIHHRKDGLGSVEMHTYTHTHTHTHVLQ